jgi:DNA primase
MPGVDFQAVRGMISMSEVLDLIGFVSCACSGQQVRGPCPIHKSSSASSRSFSANLAKNTFHCFKCGAAGNHLDLWAAVNHQNIHEAAIELCSQLARDIPWIHKW